MASIEFRCDRCKQLKDVRTLRASICSECRADDERAATDAVDAAAAQRRIYQERLACGPHYHGALETWTSADPALLPDGEHFVCPSCHRAAHLVHDLQHRWNKTPYPIPTKKTVCDACHRKAADDDQSERAMWRNRFNRER
jgi:hypothetical protein